MKKLVSFLMFLAIFVVSQLFLSSCSKEDNVESEFNNKPMNILYQESEPLVNRGKVFTIDHDFFVSIHGDRIKGDHVGFTFVRNEKGESFPVTVKGKLDYIEAPCFIWGYSQADLDNYIKGPQKVTAMSDKDMVAYAIYDGKLIKYLYTYFFNNGQLYACMLLVPTFEVETLVDWLTERFTINLIGEEVNDIFAIGYNAYDIVDAKTDLTIGAKILDSPIMKYNLFYQIIFMDAKSFNSNNVKQDIVETTNKISISLQDLGIHRNGTFDSSKFLNRITSKQ